MKTPRRSTLLSALLAFLYSAGPLVAQVTPANSPPAVMRITLEEAKQRALANNKLLNIGGLNAESKAFAIKAARSDYFPKVIGAELYTHFNEPLGTVLTTRGRPRLGVPPISIAANVLNQDTSLLNIGVVQPVTDLLKVRQGVKLAKADEQIAQAELEKGIREVASGVEQLYWGLLAVRRIQAGAREGVTGAEMLAKTQNLAARTALVAARQGLQQVDKKAADLQEQLNGLLDLPLCTMLELAEPPLPVLPFRCADEVVALALSNSPEIRSAQQTILKAEAALAAGKLDYVPSVAVVGGYVNQTGASYIQQDFSYVGAVATYTFVDWGKRKNVVRERRNLVAMATLKLHQTEDDVRQKAVKAFREIAETQEALKTAGEMAELRKEAAKKATTPEAFKDPTDLIKAVEQQGLAEVAAVTAELDYRQAYVQLMSLIGKQ